MSWQESSLGTIADMQLGKMLDAKKNDGEYHSYLGNDNIQWDGVNLSEIKEMRFKDSELAKFALKPGDLLVCEGGDPGRCAIWDSTEEMYYQKALHRVRAHEGVTTVFSIIFWFTSAQLRRFVSTTRAAQLSSIFLKQHSNVLLYAIPTSKPNAASPMCFQPTTSSLRTTANR